MNVVGVEAILVDFVEVVVEHLASVRGIDVADAGIDVGDHNVDAQADGAEPRSNQGGVEIANFLGVDSESTAGVESGGSDVGVGGIVDRVDVDGSPHARQRSEGARAAVDVERDMVRGVDVDVVGGDGGIVDEVGGGGLKVVDDDVAGNARADDGNGAADGEHVGLEVGMVGGGNVGGGVGGSDEVGVGDMIVDGGLVLSDGDAGVESACDAGLGVGGDGNAGGDVEIGGVEKMLGLDVGIAVEVDVDVVELGGGGGVVGVGVGIVGSLESKGVVEGDGGVEHEVGDALLTDRGDVEVARVDVERDVGVVVDGGGDVALDVGDADRDARSKVGSPGSAADEAALVGEVEGADVDVGRDVVVDGVVGGIGEGSEGVAADVDEVEGASKRGAHIAELYGNGGKIAAEPVSGGGVDNDA